jgi:hypothetical protein
VTAALQTVHIRVNDAATCQATPCRIRFTGPDGTDYSPFGRLTEFATSWGDDVGGNLLLGSEKHAYIDGTCEVQLPPGPVQVQITKGFEYTPLCETIQLRTGQLSLRFAIQREIDLRAEGWYSGDTGVYCMSPHAALLEAAAEDVAVVNLLAFERHIAGRKQPAAIPNILGFSGQCPALEIPGHMVVVNTHNTSLLGHLSLLNSHRAVYPLSFRDRAGLDNWSMADWCGQCHRKGGLVVWSDPWPAGSDLPIGEPLAHVLLGKVDALEAVVLPHADLLSVWYQLLNCGVRVPLVGASDKGSNNVALGSVRTYARLLPGEEFSYKNWVEAVRAARVVVTNGPLLSLTVDGKEPGSVIDVPADGKALRVRAEVRGNMAVQRLELVAGGEIVAGTDIPESRTHAVLEVDFPVSHGLWLAARCHGGAVLPGGSGPLRPYAHTAPVHVQVGGRPPQPDPRAVTSVLNELDRLLPWAEGERYFANERQRSHYAGMVQNARQSLLQRQQMPPVV